LSSADTEPCVVLISKTAVANAQKISVPLDIFRTLTKLGQLLAVSELIGEVNLA
jgi:hypothetical protein